MPIIRKGKDDRWYLLHRRGNPNSKGFIPRAKKNVTWTTEWKLIPFNKMMQGDIRMGNITSPPELIGKTIRFVVEIVEEEKK